MQEPTYDKERRYACYDPSVRKLILRPLLSTHRPIYSILRAGVNRIFAADMSNLAWIMVLEMGKRLPSRCAESDNSCV